MQLINLIVLQAGGGGFADIMAGMWPFFLIIIVFYFFIIRPQSKRQKEQVNFQESLSKGDEVITSSGIIGRIKNIEADEIILQVDTKTFIRIIPSAISKEMTEAAAKRNNEKD